MRLYNTASRQVEEIKPISDKKISIYTCGPTVYDYPHIGNWFTFIRYDLLVRTLLGQGFDVDWVMNITDVGHLVSDADEGEDKLEKGARREGKTAQQIADYYTDYFQKGLQRLNFIKPNRLPRATDHIDSQIKLIKALEDKGYTYTIDDGVYYDTAKFPKYGDFARLDVDEQEAGARVAVNPQKRNPQDFALWKFSPKDKQRDMEWDSPWGKGFPGWHLECSALILEFLGETIDIHAGGIDHIPLHHTNEIAQSEAATGKKLANYWMHTNHILVDEQKISKSEGNGITLEDIEAKGFDLEAFRLLVLQSHYRTQSHFSWEDMRSAQNRLNDLRAVAALKWQLKDVPAVGSETFSSAINEIKKNLADDLNSPLALAALSGFSDILKSRLIANEDKRNFDGFLGELDKAFGFNLSQVEDINDSQKKLIDSREQARQAKNWILADEIRNTLSSQGVEVRDTQAGPIWFRN